MYSKVSMTCIPRTHGFPHSSHSFVVKGIDESTIVTATSTNGTPRMATLNNSGDWLIVAPISRPPADLPSMDNNSDVVSFFSCQV